MSTAFNVRGERPIITIGEVSRIRELSIRERLTIRLRKAIRRFLQIDVDYHNLSADIEALGDKIEDIHEEAHGPIVEPNARPEPLSSGEKQLIVDSFYRKEA